MLDVRETVVIHTASSNGRAVKESRRHSMNGVFYMLIRTSLISKPYKDTL